MIYFNQKKVIMAVVKQTHQELEADSIPALRIFDWAKTQLNKTEELYHKRKSEIIKQVAERLESKGFPCNKICHEIAKQLSDYVSDAYIREILPAKYKDSKQSNNAMAGVEIHAKTAVRQMLVEEYEIDKVDTYSRAYLIEIVKYLHSTLALNCRQADEKMKEELR